MNIEACFLLADRRFQCYTFHIQKSFIAPRLFFTFFTSSTKVILRGRYHPLPGMCTSTQFWQNPDFAVFCNGFILQFLLAHFNISFYFILCLLGLPRGISQTMNSSPSVNIFSNTPFHSDICGGCHPFNLFRALTHKQ